MRFAATTFVAPALLLVILRQYNFTPGLLESIGLYWALVATRIGTAIAYKQWDYERRAQALGAVTVPKVHGKWPGNVDVSGCRI